MNAVRRDAISEDRRISRMAKAYNSPINVKLGLDENSADFFSKISRAT